MSRDADWNLLESTDTETVRETAARAVRSLRNREVADVLELGARLCAVIAHEHALVRQHVAEACEFLPDPMGETALVRLREDRNAYVRAAAAQSTERRAAQQKKRTREETRGRSMQEILDEIGKKHSPAARRLAERAVRLGEDNAARALHHEIAQIATPLEQAIRELLAGAISSRPNLAAMREHAEKADERLKFLRSVLDSVSELTARRNPTFREEDLGTILDEARDDLVAKFPDRAIDVRRDVPTGMVLDADRHDLKQALQNILKNAVEAYRPQDRAEIRISAKTLRAGSQIALSIEDKGDGMDEEQLRNFFVPFETGKQGGSGVGTRVVQRMVEEVHGGALSIRSARGAGTTVTMTLPVRQRNAAHRERRTNGER